MFKKNISQKIRFCEKALFFINTMTFMIKKYLFIYFL